MVAFGEASYLSKGVAAQRCMLFEQKHRNAIANHGCFVGFKQCFAPLAGHVFTVGDNGYLMISPQPLEEGGFITLPVNDQGKQYLFVGAYALCYRGIDL